MPGTLRGNGKAPPAAKQYHGRPVSAAQRLGGSTAAPGAMVFAAGGVFVAQLANRSTHSKISGPRLIFNLLASCRAPLEGGGTEAATLGEHSQQLYSPRGLRRWGEHSRAGENLEPPARVSIAV